jgi:diguanylate cyclase (GGDEF)-like protein/PAS domain S-box-containing protein
MRREVKGAVERNRTGRLVVAGAILTALIVGVAGSSALLDYAENHYRVADAVSDIHTEIFQLAAISSEVSVSVAPSPALLADIASVETRLLADVTTYEHSGFDPADSAQLRTAIGAYVASVDRVRWLGARGRIQEATALVQQNDTTSEDLAARMSVEVPEQRGLADRAAQLAKDGLLALAALVVLVVCGALLWDQRTRRHMAQARADAQSRIRFAAMVEHGSDLLVLTDSNGTQTYASPALEHLLGYRADSQSARHLSELADPVDRSTLQALLVHAVASSSAGPADIRLRHADGSTRTMEVTVVDLHDVAEVGAVLWSAHDVTERRRLEHDLERSAFQDSLTGLANRAVFRDRVEHALSRASHSGHPIAVLLADLDGFKAVNDSFGHDAGDKVLVEMAARLASCVRPGDTVARMGGDEFTILLEDLGETGLAETIADWILEIVRQPVTVDGSEMRLGVSVGIAHSASAGDTAQDMLRNADVAMYTAKSRGRGCWAGYDAGLYAQAEELLRLSSDLDGALDRGELEVRYQPTVSLATHQVEGTEALLRWHHPRLGLVMPAVFIPLAEQSGQIVPIGRWVLEQACRQAQLWHIEFPSAWPRTMCVNISGRQFGDPALVTDIATILNDTRLDPRALVLEITESVLVRDVEAVKARLHQLKDLGVRLAIDDFGTGFSSLAYLRQFPVDVLKIDRSFVEAATSGAAGGEALVRAIIDLGAGLHLATIAEGIERQDQAEQLLSLGCQIGQGYLFGRPVPVADLTAVLAAERRLLTAAR